MCCLHNCVQMCLFTLTVITCASHTRAVSKEKTGGSFSRFLQTSKMSLVAKAFKAFELSCLPESLNLGRPFVSYGNPYVSLVSGMQTNELDLCVFIALGYGALEAQINTLSTHHKTETLNWVLLQKSQASIVTPWRYICES